MIGRRVGVTAHCLLIIVVTLVIGISLGIGPFSMAEPRAVGPASAAEWRTAEEASEDAIAHPLARPRPERARCS